MVGNTFYRKTQMLIRKEINDGAHALLETKTPLPAHSPPLEIRNRHFSHEIEKI